jgi:hypothetical protein
MCSLALLLGSYTTVCVRISPRKGNHTFEETVRVVRQLQDRGTLQTRRGCTYEASTSYMLDVATKRIKCDLRQYKEHFLFIPLQSSNAQRRACSHLANHEHDETVSMQQSNVIDSVFEDRLRLLDYCRVRKDDCQFQNACLHHVLNDSFDMLCVCSVL